MNIDKAEVAVIASVLALVCMNINIYGLWGGIAFSVLTIGGGLVGYVVVDKLRRMGK